MTLKVRVIPCLDVKDGRVVKGVRFVDLTDAGDPVEAARAYDAAGADELCFLDITASHEKRGTSSTSSRAPPSNASCRSPSAAACARSRTCARCCSPAPTRCRSTPAPSSAARSCARPREKFGAQAIVVAIDAKRVSAATANRRASRSSPTAAASRPASTRSPTPREVADLGAGEILLTSMDRDGTGDGFDLELTRAIADAVPIPVVASGGVGTLDHLVEGVRDGHASAVLAASIFHFGTFTIRQAKEHMAAAGIPVRLDG